MSDIEECCRMKTQCHFVSSMYKGVSFILNLGIFLFLANAVSMFGQTDHSVTDGTTPSALATGGGGDIDSINFYNGNLNFYLPFLKIGGRGATAPVSFQKDSKGWRVVHHEGPEDEWGNSIITHRATTETGYRNNLYSPGLLSGRKAGGLNTTNCPADGGGIYRGVHRITLTRLTFSGPDNSEIEFRDQLTDGEPQYTANPCTPGFLTFNRGKVFVSRGGSGATFVSDTDILDSGFNSTINPSGYLLFADGLRMRIDAGQVSWMRDRNGNKITFGYDANARPTVLTDSLGRQMTITYGDGSVGSFDTIQFNGFGGVPRTIRIYKDSMGNLLRSGEALTSKHNLFPQLGDTGATALYNPTPVSSIVLPDGRSYQFQYNKYGEVARIVLPTGGAYEYDYTPGSGVVGAGDYGMEIYRRVVAKRTYSDPSDPNSLVNTMTITELSGGVIEVKGIAPSGQVLTREVHYYHGNPLNSFDYPAGPVGYSDWSDGREYETRSYRVNIDGTYTELRKVEYKWEQRVGTGLTGKGTDPRVYETITTLSDVGLVSKEHFNFEANISFNNKTDVYEYDYGTDVNALPLARHSHTNYFHTNTINGTTYNYDDPVYDANGNLDLAQTIYIRGLSKEQYIYGINPATGQELTTPAAKTENVFDEPYYLLNDYSSVSQWVDPGVARGNLTTLKSWYDTSNPNAYYQNHTQYDQCGNVRKSWDGNQNVSEVEYWSYNNSYAFPILTRTPAPDTSNTNGSNQQFVATRTFDFASGLPISSTDPNGITSTIEYNDLLDRPTKGITAVGTSQEHQITTVYDDAHHRIETTGDLNTLNDNLIKAESFYDGLGRTTETHQYEPNGSYVTVKSVPFLMIQDPDTQQWRAASKSSNPFRPGEAEIYTTSLADELGRGIKVITSDGAIVRTAYSGNTTTVTDQTGKKRKGNKDALGRMIRVIEDPDGQNLATDYLFDALGNLRKTTQGLQNRYFMLDSLGRVIYAKQVEQDANPAFSGANFTDPLTGNNQWSMKYSYDPGGNITSTTDARNLSITASYDHLNRLTLRDYSDPAMPDVNFYYDGRGLGSIPDHSLGKTTKITSSVSETRNTSFDITGRLLTSQQITDGQTYEFGYTYNLTGALLEERYPSGRIVKNTVAQDGKLLQVQSKKDSNHGFWTYADSFTYDAAGVSIKMQLGNGRWETVSVNNRLQVTQLGLGSTDAAQDLLKLEFSYNSPNQTDNNGSMREQKITVPTVGANPGFTATQSYAYDSLNRIQSATETISGNQTWKQTFSYDRYGNRQFDTNNNNTTTLASCLAAVCNPTVSTTNNRFSTGQNYLYDADGDVIQDAQGQRFGYDSENRQNAFFAAGNNTTTPDATYFYDGDGRRVKKISGSEITIFVYDASGQLSAEYSTQIETVKPQVSYLTTDHLGSPRIITDQNGAVTSRKDFAAFGDEILSPQRVGGTNGNGYNPPNVRQDYTGYQKDQESGLEYSVARYYNPSHGRYTSVDPLPSSAEIKNPQTFNRYSYVTNSPYKFTDPLGLAQSWCGAEHGSCNDTGATEPDWLQSDRDLDFADFNRRLDTIIQKETRNYTVVQTEADGKQATITITSEVTRSISRSTNRQISPDSTPIVGSRARNTGRQGANFSNNELRIMEQVTSDIVEVALTTGRSPTLFLAMAQRETHLGIGSIGDPRNRGKAEMIPEFNPLQLDGDANGKYWARPGDRKYNITWSMHLFQENAAAAGTNNLTDALSVYNSGKFANKSTKGAAYAADILSKSSAIKETMTFANKRLLVP